MGMEACATAHHWARELIALGHEVKLMPPAYVKAYVKRNKNDAADAEAICEAVTRPSMRFVPVKDVDQQSVLMMHRARASAGSSAHHAGQRAARASGRVRNHRAAGTAPRRTADRGDRSGKHGFAGTCTVDSAADRGPVERHPGKIQQVEAKLAQWHRNSRLSRLLATIPGVGIMGASAIAATVMRSEPVPLGTRVRGLARHDAAPKFLGGKERLGANQQTRRQIYPLSVVAGAVADLRHARTRATKDAEWVRGMLARKPAKVVAVALANRTARIVWAVMKRGDAYRAKEIVGQAAA